MLLFLPLLLLEGFVQRVDNFQLTSSMENAFAIAMILLPRTEGHR